METIILPNPKDYKEETVSINIELGKTYEISIYEMGTYMATIEAVTNNSIIVTDVKTVGNAPIDTKYHIHGTEGKKAVFPAAEIYDIESC